MTPVTKKQWQRSERAVSRGQVSGNRLQDGSLLIANIGIVTIAKDSLAAVHPKGEISKLCQIQIHFTKIYHI
jgi:hypothetical protein